ncbi:MAG: cyclase family protein [Chloroflexi bacterium]|nr:cyclase family protein [Chloroflexota bacterium]
MAQTTATLTNWGRWGPGDELGALNLIGAAQVQKAARLVKRGRVYSLSVPLSRDGPQWPLRHKTWQVTTHRNDPSPGGTGGCDDVLTMHSHSGTHMDALCHVWYDSKMYNGYDVEANVTSLGTGKNAIANVRALVGRGVLLDVARFLGVDHLDKGQQITSRQLDDCAQAQKVAIEPGDVVLVRTGWMRLFASDRALFDSGEPGVNGECVRWVKAHDVVAVGADNHGVEAMAVIPPARLPFHLGAIRDLGVYLLENLDLEELAADHAYEFLLIVAPLRLPTGVGSPINPVAIA